MIPLVFVQVWSHYSSVLFSENIEADFVAAMLPGSHVFRTKGNWSTVPLLTSPDHTVPFSMSSTALYTKRQAFCIVKFCWMKKDQSQGNQGLKTDTLNFLKCSTVRCILEAKQIRKNSVMALPFSMLSNMFNVTSFECSFLTLLLSPPAAFSSDNTFPQCGVLGNDCLIVFSVEDDDN